MIVRHALKGDDLAIHDLAKTVIGACAYYDADERAENIARYTPQAIANGPRRLLGVAEEYGALAGFIDGEIDGAGEGVPVYVRWVICAPAFRRRRVALALIAWVIEQAAARGCHKVYADTAMANAAPMALFARAGFIPEGIQWALYPNL